MNQDKLQSACDTLVAWLMEHEGFPGREPWMEAVNAIGIRAKYEAEHTDNEINS